MERACGQPRAGSRSEAVRVAERQTLYQTAVDAGDFRVDDGIAGFDADARANFGRARKTLDLNQRAANRDDFAMPLVER
jgi:hypothetical protein